MLEKAYLDLWVGAVFSLRVVAVVGHVNALYVSPAFSDVSPCSESTNDYERLSSGSTLSGGVRES